MRSRIRVIAMLVSAALFAAGCGAPSASVAATVGDQEISMEVFERIVERKSEGLGLVGRQADLAENAIEAGLLQRDTLNTVVNQTLTAETRELDDGVRDQLFTAYEEAVGADAVASAREDAGLTEEQWRTLFDAVADAEFTALVAGIPPEIPLDRADQVAAAQREVLTLLIQIAALEKVFNERDLALEEGAVDTLYEEELASVGGAEDDLAARLAGTGLDVEDFRDLILTTFARQSAISESLTELSDEEIEARLDEGQASGEFVTGTVSHILVETEEQANDLLQQLEEGADFAALAEEHSLDTGSAANGGQLPESPLASYVPEFRDAAAAAPIGEVVGPVETQFGFHLIRVDSREELSREDAEAQIREESAAGANQRASQLLQQTLAETEIIVPSRFGVWDPTAGRVLSSDPLADTGGGAGTGPGAPAPQG